MASDAADRQRHYQGLGKGARWFSYLLTTFFIGLLPWVAHWVGDWMLKGVAENPLSLPEGYIFAFLLAAGTCVEIGVLDKPHNDWFDYLRILAFILCLALSGFFLVFYVDMLKIPYPHELMDLQWRLGLPVAALNVTYMSIKYLRL